METKTAVFIVLAVALELVCKGEDDIDENYKKSMEEAHSLSVTINKNLENYDRKLRPNAGGKPVMVEVEFKVISFGEIKEVNMEYSMDIFFRQWWKDPRMRHNSSKPFNMAYDPTSLIWTPDTYFWNVKHAKYHRVTRENMRVRISADGEIYFSTRISVVAHCDMDLHMYPMDTQTCELRIESYAHTMDDVDYKWRSGNNKGIEIVSSKMAQFDLLRYETFNDASINSKGSFAKLRAEFKFRRRLDYHISSVYLPEVILVVLSWCTFFITPSAVPARVSLSITTILTTILLSSTVNSEIPKVSYLKSIDFFMLTSFGFIFSALVEYIIVLNTSNVFWRKKTKEMNHDTAEEGLDDIVLKLNGSPKKMELSKLRPRKPMERSADAPSTDHWVDKTSRVLFPALFVLFLMIYTVHYKSRIEE
ncbi:PREDICTED: gamma-aminobutyric acid receptor subunit beta-2-like [Acropora digitifera]|uniref:gamma-aminobutyric acid receptor subunit beta-2-like n=1 Tax=Acropora digitifera TaxID=70779 RepID=UPI00077ACAD5|nr:PREDICTED: gamma-aminobutyric acid receptor subunit beta-2-like [Acropora digitifera]